MKSVCICITIYCLKSLLQGKKEAVKILQNLQLLRCAATSPPAEEVNSVWVHYDIQQYQHAAAAGVCNFNPSWGRTCPYPVPKIITKSCLNKKINHSILLPLLFPLVKEQKMKLLHYNGDAGCKISQDAILNTGHFFLSAIKCLLSLNGREKSQ